MNSLFVLLTVRRISVLLSFCSLRLCQISNLLCLLYSIINVLIVIKRFWYVQSSLFARFLTYLVFSSFNWLFKCMIFIVVCLLVVVWLVRWFRMNNFLLYSVTLFSRIVNYLQCLQTLLIRNHTIERRYTDFADLVWLFWWGC